jgi:hypothetical protein
MMAKRIQRKRTKDYSQPFGTIYVGRPTKWGNPFGIGKYLNAWGKAFIAIRIAKQPEEIRGIYKQGFLYEKISLENSLKWYQWWLDFQIENKRLDPKQLKGANLSCWCPLDQPCHADILLKLANIPARVENN